VNGFNIVYQHFIAICTVVRSAVTGPDSSQLLMRQHTPNRVADKHDTPPSHFKRSLGQAVLLWSLNGERYKPNRYSSYLFINVARFAR